MAEKIKNVSYPVVNQAGEAVSKVSLNGEVFGIEPNNQVMFDAVQVYQANCRQATARTKTRDEVSGGGKKPWRHKGTGRARAGSSRSPIWVGGGTVFGPRGLQNYKLSMNKKAHNLALRSALSSKVANKELIVVESLNVENPKTKEVAQLLKTVGANGKTLVVLHEENANLIQGGQNIQSLLICGLGNVSVYDLLNANCVVLTKDCVKALEGGLK